MTSPSEPPVGTVLRITYSKPPPFETEGQEVCVWLHAHDSGPPGNIMNASWYQTGEEAGIPWETVIRDALTVESAMWIPALMEYRR